MKGPSRLLASGALLPFLAALSVRTGWQSLRDFAPLSVELETR